MKQYIMAPVSYTHLKRAKNIVCAAVFFLLAVPSPVRAGEEESLQVENRIVLDKVEIALEEFQENEAGERSPCLLYTSRCV